MPEGIPARCWHLWEVRRGFPEARTLSGFGAWLNERAAAEPGDGTSRILIGYSLGGRLGLHALTSRPDLWQAAVILSAHPGLTEMAAREERVVHDKALAEKFRQAPWRKVLVDWNAQPVLAGGPPASIPEEWRGEVASGLEDWSLGKQEDLLPPLNQCGVPVLWITGGRDHKFTGLAARVAERCPSVQHLTIEGAGHRLPQECPSEIRERISAFLLRQRNR